jgi:hypothetical protein
MGCQKLTYQTTEPLLKVVYRAEEADKKSVQRFLSDAYRQESNYTRIILQGMGRSKLEIMNVIKVNYGNKDYIIKEFHQYCEPEKP